MTPEIHQSTPNYPIIPPLFYPRQNIGNYEVVAQREQPFMPMFIAAVSEPPTTKLGKKLAAFVWPHLDPAESAVYLSVRSCLVYIIPPFFPSSELLNIFWTFWYQICRHFHLSKVSKSSRSYLLRFRSSIKWIIWAAILREKYRFYTNKIDSFVQKCVCSIQIREVQTCPMLPDSEILSQTSP